MKKKLHIITYGCQMNEDDSQLVAGKFAAAGFALTEDPEKADVIVLNTCTVRQHAEDRAVSKLGRLRKWKEAKPGRKIVFMGCAAERLGKDVKRRFPFTDEVVGARSLEKFDAILEEWGTAPGRDADCLKLFNSPVTDYQTVMRGCSLNCAYCVVPSVRGKAVSLPEKEILSAIKKKAENGIKEIVLLGQTVNSYRDPDSGLDFAGLLEKAAAVKGVKRIKFMSPHPLYFKKDFFGLYAREKKLSRHVHLPLQSGSDAVLKKMRRGYTAEQYLAITEKLRAADPDMSLSTDFIVGFPGETEKDFGKTLEMAEKLRLSFAFCFKYSPRTGRPEDISDIGEKETERRLAGLLAVVRKKSGEILHSRIGKIEEVLIEKENSGRTSTGFNCSIIGSGKSFKAGETIKVKIKKAEKNILCGEAEK